MAVVPPEKRFVREDGDGRRAVSGILDGTSLREVARRSLELADQKSRVLNYTI